MEADEVLISHTWVVEGLGVNMMQGLKHSMLELCDGEDGDDGAGAEVDVYEQ